MLIVPLTSIKQQILVDCGKLGISVLDGDQVLPVLNITHFSTIIELVESSFHSSLHPTWRESLKMRNSVENVKFSHACEIQS